MLYKMPHRKSCFCNVCYTIWFLIPDFSLLNCRLVNLSFQTIYKLQTKAPLSVPLEHLFAKPTEMAIFPKMMLQTIDSLINLSFFFYFLNICLPPRLKRKYYLEANLMFPFNVQISLCLFFLLGRAYMDCFRRSCGRYLDWKSEQCVGWQQNTNPG